MELSTLVDVLERILDSSHAAILSTVDEDGRPYSRWMTPATLRGQAGALYTVTAPAFRKVDQIRKNSKVSWLVQSKALDEIIEVHGTATIIDHPTLKSDVLEAIGPNLTAFWRVNPNETELVVIETAIERIDYYKPLKDHHESATV